MSLSYIIVQEGSLRLAPLPIPFGFGLVLNVKGCKYAFVVVADVEVEVAPLLSLDVEYPVAGDEALVIPFLLLEAAISSKS